MMPMTARMAKTLRHEPMPAIVNPHGSMPCGNNPMATRRQPYAPSFITTPASNIEAAVGAATWPVGAQVWKGHKPARIPNPTNVSGNAHNWKCGESPECASASSEVEWLPEVAYAASSTMSTMAEPTNE